MASPKDILVTTTSSVEGLKIKKHLKPVTAHIVAGTNLFSDFLGSLTDVFGGRSGSYQKQLTSLYNEAIERIKYNAYEIGGNCVVGLSIDMDEISGKGKSMFMLTAIGTAVIIENDDKSLAIAKTIEKFENVGIERINNLRQRNKIISKANSKNLSYNDETWNFITINQVDEIFPMLIRNYAGVIENCETMKDPYEVFNRNFVSYIDALEESKRINLLFNQIEEEKNMQVALYLSKVIKELNLFDFERSILLLKNPNFNKQKLGLRIATYDKLFYDKNDVENLVKTKSYIISNFKERGEKTTKKQLLSTKEKEIWICECSKTNDIEEKYCSDCKKDIFGFKKNEIRPEETVQYIDEKMALIKEFLE